MEFIHNEQTGILEAWDNGEYMGPIITTGDIIGNYQNAIKAINSEEIVKLKERLSKLDFDTHFDFRSDNGGKDPDIGSPTLRRYHRLLWSKRLPNGEMMQLTHDKGGYLKWQDFEFGSDAVGNGMFFKRAEKSIS